MRYQSIRRGRKVDRLKEGKKSSQMVKKRARHCEGKDEKRRSRAYKMRKERRRRRL